MKIKNLLTTLALTATFLFVGNVGWGQALLVENFDYPIGNLLTDNGWVGHSGTGTNNISVSTNTISLPTYASSNIGNEVLLLANGQDVNKTFTAQTTGYVYAALLVNVTSTSTTGDYFFHFGPNTIGSNFRGRLFVKKDAANKLAFGVAHSGTAVYTTFDYDLNTTYLIVMKYSIVAGTANDVISININQTIPTEEPSTGWLVNTDTPTDPTDIGSIALRQGTAGNAVNVKVDGIRVATTWADAAKYEADVTAPTTTFSPVNGATDVAVNTTITISFNEAIRNTDNSEITDVNVGSLVTFKEKVSGNTVAATTTIDASKKVITITPSANLTNELEYEVAVAPVEDAYNNATVSQTSSFTTIAAATPTIALTSPNGGEKYYAGQEVTITWTSTNMDAENIKIEAYVRSGLTANWNWIEAIASTANDGSANFTIPASATSGTQYKIRVTGLTSSTADESDAAFTVIATPSINEIQSNNTAGASAWLGELVKVTGVVTAVTTDTKNYYLQSGSGAWNAIYVYNNATHTYAVGNNLSIEGTVDEFNGLTQIKTITSTVVNNPTDVVPAAAEISTLDATTENYESVLVKVKKAECMSGSAGNFTVNDGTGNLVAYKGIYGDFTLTIGKFYDITGVMTWYNAGSIFEILPRNASDVYELSSNANVGLFGIGGKLVNELAGLKVTDPATDAGANLFFDDFTGLKGIGISGINANATIEVKLNGAVVNPANYADQALVENDVIVAKVTSEDGTATNYYKVTLKLENRVITVTAPTGGQTYNTGDVVTITWTATNVTNVNIWAYVTVEDVLIQLNTTPISAATGTFDYTIKNGDAGIVYIAVTDANDESFYAQSAGTVTVIDNVKPAITSRYPAVNKYGVGKAFTIELNFDEYIKAGTGNLKVFKASDNSEVKTATAAELTIDDMKATLTVTGLDYTVGYYITADAGLIKDNSNNESEAINANDWKFTTMAPRGGDLFISEYLEGGSNNKAIELYNPSSESIDLSQYTMKKGTNGANFSTNLALTGTLAPGDVYVIANNGSVTAIKNVTDLIDTNGDIVYFNGDDAIGLFKNGTLIDVIGTTTGTDPGDGWNVAGTTNGTLNHTLVRKSSVVKGNTDWTASAGTNTDNSEWIVYNQDDFNYLGSHNMTLSSANAITEFSIANQVSATIDANAKTVSVVMPYGVALTNLTPTITLSYGAYTIPASGVAQDFSSAFEYVAIAMDGTANVWTVTATNAAASSAKEIVTFSIPSQVSSNIVAGTATINVVMPAGTNLTSLTPTITVSQYATIDPASGVARNFSSPATYTVTAQDGSTKVWTVNVSVGSSAPDQPFASFKAYPNPFSNEIRFDGAEIARVTITSIIGQVVMDKVVTGETSVETQSLSKGIYLVKFTNIKGESVLRKLIKE